MFEQTFLPQPASAQKTGAFAVSLMAQMCVLGVLLIGPLLYTQTLPLIPLKFGLTLDPPRPPELPPTHQKSTPSSDAPVPNMRVLPRFVPQPTASRSPVFTGASAIALPEVETSDFTGPVDGTRIGTPAVGIGESIPVGNPPPTKIATVATATIEPPAGPLKINTGVLASKLITKVIPDYPLPAKAVHAAGIVRLLAVVGIDGHVKELRVLEGHPLLRKAAEEAVRQWIYSPTYLSGRPVEVEASIEVNFALN